MTLDVPVVSVGNVTVGGTGKTPLALYIAKYYQDNGFVPAVVTRGYRKQGRALAVVSDGEHAILPPWRAGDEAYFLATSLPGIPVVVGPNRVTAAYVAMGKFSPDVIVMDDAFQHLRVDRNLDIVLVDAANPFGNERALPRGTLREPPSHVSRAGLIVLTRVDQAPSLSAVRERVRSLNAEAPIVETMHVPVAVWRHPTRSPLEISDLKGARVVAVSSIGNPAAFEATLVAQGASVLGHLRFPNHARYRRRLLAQIDQAAREYQCDAVVTTEKDMVRLPPTLGLVCPIWVVSVRLQIVEGENYLHDALNALVRVSHAEEEQAT
jgi:tetraacyldisaccharide 4'-kinase